MSNPNDTPLILASGSPRRLEILRAHGLEPIVLVPQLDEDALIARWDGTSVSALVEQLARAKAEATWCMLAPSRTVCSYPKPSPRFILAADTIVYKDRILGKPKTEGEALDTLMLLSGTTHQVYTGAALLSAQDGSLLWQMHDRTSVTFVSYSRETALAYIRNEQPYDKAGSYAIQDSWGRNVSALAGDYHTVVGLPTSVALRVVAAVASSSSSQREP